LVPFIVRKIPSGFPEIGACMRLKQPNAYTIFIIFLSGIDVVELLRDDVDI
jgi:hypothetical protein